MLYELTMTGTYFGQQWVNRWNYESSGSPGAGIGALNLVWAFGAIDTAGVYPAGGIFQAIRSMISNQVQIQSIVARACALYAPEDFYERPFLTPVVGLDGGQALSPTMAYGFRTTRVRLDIDRGTKRFVGCTEATVDAGGVVSSAGQAIMASLAAKMTAPITHDDEGNTWTFVPTIVSKQEYTTPRGKKAYRYYPTLVQQLEHVAQGFDWQPYTQVRTQTSRQYGRGG